MESLGAFRVWYRATATVLEVLVALCVLDAKSSRNQSCIFWFPNSQAK